MSDEKPAAPRFRLAAVGCGGFSRLAVPAAAALPNIELIAVADPVRDNARALADDWQAARVAAGHPPVQPAIFPDHHSLLAGADPDVVWILTPPHLHHPLARDCLAAGRHVFLEKPGSLSLAQVDELISLAEGRGVHASVDFVMRHNPIHRFIRAAAAAGAFGPLERVALENNACGDHLPPDHWFWDEARSGGVWVEHGVHFFDLATWLAGPPAAVVAGGVRRSLPGDEVPDATAAIAVHPSPAPDARGPALVSHYHGFTRPGPFERTTLSLVFERAYLLVRGWIAVTIEGEVLAGPEQEEALAGLRPGNPWLRVAVREEYPASKEKMELFGRGRPFTARRRLALSGDLGDRWAVYRDSIRAGLLELLRAAVVPGHRPDVDLGCARAALNAALAARESQRSGVRIHL